MDLSHHDLAIGHQTRCQICGGQELDLVIDLGHHPPCDSLLTSAQLGQPERVYPLRLLRCPACGLAQIDYVVPPQELFYPEYPYRSGITPTLARNLYQTAERVAQHLDLREGDLAVDIGANDGTLLQGFRSRGMRVLGVEPTNIADIAVQDGIPMVKSFFGEELGRALRTEHGPARVIAATNVFAHVPNLGDFLRGIAQFLADDGVFVSESHYLLDLVETVQYDSIYHEHLRYYALRPLQVLLEQYGLTITDVERIPNYGGSIRVYAERSGGRRTSPRVQDLLRQEQEVGLYAAETYAAFSQKVLRSKFDLLEKIVDARRAGRVVAGIGCPGRASTLLNYCGLDSDLVPYVAEQATSLKLGLFTPGKHIPVVDERILFETPPDLAVMLSWHYARPIVEKLRRQGLACPIVLPLPEVSTLGASN